MLDYRELRFGEKVKIETHEFDGDCSICGIITLVSSDHAIMTSIDGDDYWIDDDTAFQFSRR